MKSFATGAAVVLGIYWLLGNVVPEAVAVVWWTGFWNWAAVLTLLLAGVVIAIIIAMADHRRPPAAPVVIQQEDQPRLTVNGNMHVTVNILLDDRAGRSWLSNLTGSGKPLNGRATLEHHNDQ